MHKLHKCTKMTYLTCIIEQNNRIFVNVPKNSGFFFCFLEHCWTLWNRIVQNYLIQIYIYIILIVQSYLEYFPNFVKRSGTGNLFKGTFVGIIEYNQSFLNILHHFPTSRNIVELSEFGTFLDLLENYIILWKFWNIQELYAKGRPFDRTELSGISYNFLKHFGTQNIQRHCRIYSNILEHSTSSSNILEPSEFGTFLDLWKIL